MYSENNVNIFTCLELSLCNFGSFNHAMYFTPSPFFFRVNISPVSAFALCPHTMPDGANQTIILHTYHIFYITYFPGHVTVIYNPNKIRTLYINYLLILN
jgi:hypothetical protein